MDVEDLKTAFRVDSCVDSSSANSCSTFSKLENPLELLCWGRQTGQVICSPFFVPQIHDEKITELKSHSGLSIPNVDYIYNGHPSDFKSVHLRRDMLFLFTHWHSGVTGRRCTESSISTDLRMCWQKRPPWYMTPDGCLGSENHHRSCLVRGTVSPRRKRMPQHDKSPLLCLTHLKWWLPPSYP